jgi:hypothetical protein
MHGNGAGSSSDRTISRPTMRCVRALLLLVPYVAVPAQVAGQDEERQGPPASQHGTISQTVNTTDITVTYDRPSARGRVLFGVEDLVVYDALWTPGANRATTLEFSRDVRVAGQPVPAGRYSVWTIPAADDWTLILNRVWDTHHAIYPGDVDDVLRIQLTPESGAHMETLAIYFPVVGPYETTMRIHWGQTILPVPIEVGR